MPSETRGAPPTCKIPGELRGTLRWRVEAAPTSTFAPRPSVSSGGSDCRASKWSYQVTAISFSTNVAPGADHAVSPAKSRAFQVVTCPVNLILPP